MKHRITILLVLLPLVLASCSKDDFSELRHLIVLEGEFDPVYGIPLAKMSADMATMVGMLDFNNDVSIYVGEDDIVSFRYYYDKHFTMSWVASKDASKGARKSEFDTIRSYSLIEGTQTFDLFEKLQIFDTNDFNVNEFLVTVDADVKGYVNSSFQEVVARGANLTFDSLAIVIHCMDGYTEVLPQLITTDKVSVTDLLETKNIPIFEHYNLKNVIEHRPTSVDYSVRMCITIPTEQMMPGSDFDEYMQELGVDSMMADLHACLELPLNFYSHHISYSDTLPLDLSNLEEQLSNIEGSTLQGDNYAIRLNDSNCYIAFVTNNYLPLELNLNVTFLDGAGNEILHTLFEGDRAMYAAPVVPLPGRSDTWVSNGASSAQFKAHLSLEELKQLCNTRKLVYDIQLNTANNTLPGPKQYVAVRMDDKIDIRSYVVLSPHADFSFPIELPEIPFIK
ncbi:MAG: hypothetical protein IJK84_09865 [Bacteroidales bacterium]|nr:hypothetical protein [Bacteroidales bacterium]